MECKTQRNSRLINLSTYIRLFSNTANYKKHKYYYYNIIETSNCVSILEIKLLLCIVIREHHKILKQ